MLHYYKWQNTLDFAYKYNTKMFISDILHVAIQDFIADVFTLSVKIWCPGLFQEKLWSAWGWVKE